MRHVTATEVMIEHNDQLARNPRHLKRLMEFWPRENIVHCMAKLLLEEIERNNAKEEQ
ncbi:hypothetical protein L585_13620 [Pantoea ananatis BRT175]|uniref:hypothetical protein n=1 Tax=Pantoea ananas TaxID=553 RepID=UPI0003B1A851|nr:hypothetical protein [Pantoea ananatis]ERM13505.1 hypothetical protein L585_13620 [Pantoea ananatis BRT175]